MQTIYACDAGILLLIKGMLTIGKVKSSHLSYSFVQLYHDEKKLHFDGMMTKTVKVYTLSLLMQSSNRALTITTPMRFLKDEHISMFYF